jgi:hypothetical protein
MYSNTFVLVNKVIFILQKILQETSNVFLGHLVKEIIHLFLSMINYAYYMIKKSHVDWIDIKKN